MQQHSDLRDLPDGPARDELTDRLRDVLRQKLCKVFCSYYKPGKKEELACLGYDVIRRLMDKGVQIDFTPREKSAGQDDVLIQHLCQHCPFCKDDCDYAAKREKSLPCGGYILLRQLLEQGTISIDDISIMN
jgi:hypothetical protein